ncbi:MAG: hypothetical protein HY680_02890 [Chloroflexi bacterium]|nr:hypothetical protein [Chloroflexota bacterium]
MAVLSVDVAERTPYAAGMAFGSTGPYEVLQGALRFGFDPQHPANTAITDIGLAERNGQGQVECTADFRIFRPVDSSKGRRRLLVDVVHRGNSVAFGFFNGSVPATGRGLPDPGSGFLMRHGFTVLQCGWQFDVAPTQGLRLQSPFAQGPSGPPTGKIVFTFQPNTRERVQEVFPGIYQRSLPNNLDSGEAVLTVRDYEDDPPQVVPRGQWRFAREADGRVAPDASYLYMESCFLPGKVYQVTYPTTGSRVSGLGLIATRDAAAFLRHGGAAQGNPCAGELDYAYTFGVSLTGRFLRLFLYLGLNVDEQGRQVFDGIHSHIAGGRRAEFNKRFPQLSSLAKRTVSYFFPYTDTEQQDPLSDKRDGLLNRQRAKGGLPRVFFTNTAAEYYGSLGSLVHTNVEGTIDAPPSETVRVYQFSGTQHGAGSLPFSSAAADGVKLQQPMNIVDYRPLVRAALLNLDAWASQGVEPPASRHPRISDGTLVRPEAVAPVFNRIPGVAFPKHLHALTPQEYQAGLDPARIYYTDGGQPLAVGVAFSNLVPVVDQDGNEQGGIRLPDVSVPVASNTGWNVRHKDIGGGDQMIGLTGASVPFPATRAQRQATGDPRRSIEERYATREEYLALVRKAAQALVDQRYMLAEDIERTVEQAAQRYDLLMGGAVGVTAPGGVA